MIKVNQEKGISTDSIGNNLDKFADIGHLNLLETSFNRLTLSLEFGYSLHFLAIEAPNISYFPFALVKVVGINAKVVTTSNTKVI